MGNDFEVGVDVAVPPDAAWALAGDPARVGEWFGPVVACEVTGDERRATMANGAVLVEKLIDRDEVARLDALTDHHRKDRLSPQADEPHQLTPGTPQPGRVVRMHL